MDLVHLCYLPSVSKDRWRELVIYQDVVGCARLQVDLVHLCELPLVSKDCWRKLRRTLQFEQIELNAEWFSIIFVIFRWFPRTVGASS